MKSSPAVTFLAIGTFVLACPTAALAQGGDVTVFGGYAFPNYNYTFSAALPPVSAVPGVDITPNGDFTLEASGGSVFGVAAAFELGGFFGIEGRWDSTGIKLKSSGASYAFSGDLSGSISIGAGPIPVDRLNVLSANIRLRTPGVVTFYVSGGLSYLPDFSVGGSIPLTVEFGGLSIPAVEIPVRLVVAPGNADYRFGVNAGAGLRFPIAPKVSLSVEGRVFYFKQYELTADLGDVPGFGDLGTFGLIKFDPVLVNVVGGVTIRF